jgi:hypothetical protein
VFALSPLVPALLALAWACASPAAASVGVGARYGWLDAQGDLFEGSGDLGGGDLVGIHLDLGFSPFLGLEVAGEYVNDDLAFTSAYFDEIEARGSGNYENLTIYLTARLYPLQFSALPLRGYVGGGVHVNYAELEIDEAQAVTGKRAAQGLAAARPAGRAGAGDIEDDLRDAVADVTGSRNGGGWHAVAGLALRFGVSPFSLFVEGRYAEPFEGDSESDTGDESDGAVISDDLPKHKSVYAGVSIEL